MFIQATSRWKRSGTYLLLIAPALILFTVFFIVPFFRSLYFSFTDLYGYNRKFNFVGLVNYIDAFKDEHFISAVIVTLKYTLFVVLFGNILSLLLAIILDTGIKGKGVLRTVFFIPNVMSLIIVGFVWTFIYGDVSRTVFQTISPTFQISWLGNTELAIFSIGITAIWQSAGYAMVIYIAGLQGISQDIIEAAKIDGAKSKSILLKIKMPLLFPVVIMNLILAATSCLKVFDFPMAMTSGGPGYSTTTIALYIYTVGFKMQMTGYATALSLILFLIISAITVLMFSFQKSREDKLL